jgi:type IV secretion system protein VirB2
MQTLSGSLGGTVAFSIGVIAFVIAGAILVFGNDLSDFARRVVLVVLACSMIFLAATFLTTLFGATGAIL